MVVDVSKNQSISGYEDTTTSEVHTGDGSTLFFGTSFTPTDANELVVQVGGTATKEFTIGGDSTAGITFTTAPSSGLTIRITRKTGAVWYTAGSGTAANGLGLQQSSTKEVLFLQNAPADLSLL